MTERPDLIAVAEPCPHCKGVGTLPPNQYRLEVLPCPLCSGDGSRYVVTDRTVAEAVNAERQRCLDAAAMTKPGPGLNSAAEAGWFLAQAAIRTAIGEKPDA